MAALRPVAPQHFMGVEAEVAVMSVTGTTTLTRPTTYGSVPPQPTTNIELANMA